MKAFARLLDQLAFTPARNAKLTLLRDYLGSAPDPERGWALASLTGALSFEAAKPGFIRKAAEAHHPKTTPHFYLMTIGVDPKFQGQGLGGALLDATLAKIDAKGLPSYLESSNEKNVPLYRRHGYEVTKEFRPAPDAPPLWHVARGEEALGALTALPCGCDRGECPTNFCPARSWCSRLLCVRTELRPSLPRAVLRSVSCFDRPSRCPTARRGRR